jgi:hypothetical protein
VREETKFKFTKRVRDKNLVEDHIKRVDGELLHLSVCESEDDINTMNKLNKLSQTFITLNNNNNNNNTHLNLEQTDHKDSMKGGGGGGDVLDRE